MSESVIEVGQAPGGSRQENATSCQPQLTRPGSVARNGALDFTKGALVLLMVLYHWINYFVSRTGDFYKYIRFITPSFIFITGFLLTNIYLARYSPGDLRLHRRLIQRGAKLLVLFGILNIVVGYLGHKGGITLGRGASAFAHTCYAVFVTGDRSAVAFAVLAPISYLLLIAPLLLLCVKAGRGAFAALTLLFLSATYAFELLWMGNAYLELLAIGVLGMLLGLMSQKLLANISSASGWIVGANVLYLVVLTFWREVYPVQVIGVCCNVSLLYLLGTCMSSNGRVNYLIMELGQYSLLAYIVQIAVLLGIWKVLGRFELNLVTRCLALLCVVAVTVLWIRATHLARRKWPVMDLVYKWLFA